MQQEAQLLQRWSTSAIITVQGHSRSLILISIESQHLTSYE